MRDTARTRTRPSPAHPRVLDLLEADLTEELAPWYPGRDEFANEVVDRAVSGSTRPLTAGAISFLPPNSSGTPPAAPMDDYSAPAEKKRGPEPPRCRPSTSSTCSRRARAACPATSTPTATSPPRASCPATTSPACRSWPMSRRPAMGAAADLPPAAAVPRPVRVRPAQPRLPRGARLPRRACAAVARPREGNARRRTRLPTKSVRICTCCGAGHFDDQASTVTRCGTSLGDAEIVNHIYRIENVSTQQASASPRTTRSDSGRASSCRPPSSGRCAITSGRAPRRRRGCRRRDRRASPTGRAPRSRASTRASAVATKDPARLQDRSGLGYWAKNEDEGDEPTDPTASPRQWIVPSVQDRKNALLRQSTAPELTQSTLATLQHALLRGLEAVFQLERARSSPSRCRPAMPAAASCSTRPPRAAPACSRGSSPNPSASPRSLARRWP
jgi:hypothetical protein